MEVYIIRHTPVAIDKDTCYGQSNVPLADTFLEDVKQLKNQLPIDFDAVYCSPSQRCKDLAMKLDLDNVQYHNALMEMNFGNWEYQKWNDINQNDLNRWMADFVNIKTPSGENLNEMYSRVKTFLDDLRMQKHRKVLLVTHQGVIRCLWAYMLEIPLQNIFKISSSYGRIFIVNMSKETKLDSIKNFI